MCLGWAVLEFTTGDPFWGVLAGGAGVYAAYVLLWNFKPVPPEAPKVPEEKDSE